VPEAPEPSAPETPVEPQPELQMAPEQPGPTAPEDRGESTQVKDDLEFETEETDAPVRLTKIKFSNQSDIEKEVEKLAQEFGGKS